MKLLDQTVFIKPIGSYSEGFGGNLKEYSFAKVKSEFVRDLSELPFALGSILHSEIPFDKRSMHTSDIAYLAERIVGEWLKKHTEYSFQPEARYVYQSDSGKNMHISARANDFTFLDDGSIVNVEVKFIANGGASRRTHRFQSGTEQLQSCSEMIKVISRDLDPESTPIKPENIILIIRKNPSNDQEPGDGQVSRTQRIYNKLLATARLSETEVQIPRLILSYQDLTKIFRSLYPEHKPTKDFSMTETCLEELREFIVKNT